ncbi:MULTISPECIES: hypothetical protein [Streptomyces violaceusniger group]|uniref:Uncharacterized protein n=1 Tax=Streptomyces antimycoticus TaxID=68175 RepID=A0ABD5JID7_9ACTN|nr:hypothetical protein [Streptomyces violaceusniger]MEE4588188.1 hypothetical protein [Streptomyces sp. DSM 41602]
MSDEPVLAALLAEAGIGEDSSEARENLIGDAVATVLAAVGDAAGGRTTAARRRERRVREHVAGIRTPPAGAPTGGVISAGGPKTDPVLVLVDT